MASIAEPAAVAPAQTPSMHRLIIAATIGNVFEWFDFVVYGFFAVAIAEVFFPTGAPTVALLIPFCACGLVVRGGFDNVADPPGTGRLGMADPLFLRHADRAGRSLRPRESR